MLPTREQLLTALVVTLAFTALAWRMRGVDRSGAWAGGIICFLLLAAAGPGAFAALVTVFLLAWASTHAGYRRKQAHGTAESKTGRSAFQVLANLGVATACAVLYLACSSGYWKVIFLSAMTAAFAEAAADTVSSELGRIQDYALLITTWKKVPSGTDGGISLTGTSAGICTAILVCAVCFTVGLVSWRNAEIALLAASMGMFADSFLGAWLESRRWLNNDGVNFLSTLIAACLAILFASF
jgi:uncharacterized protein (TIGR00297 family)